MALEVKLDEISTTRGVASGVILRNDAGTFSAIYMLGCVTFTATGSTRAEAIASIRETIEKNSLVEKGVEIFWGGYCPVQGTGMVDGLPCYFRARGEHWQFCVAQNAGDDPLDAYEDKPGAFYTEGDADKTDDNGNDFRAGYVAEFRAGYMAEDEVKRHLHEAIDRFRKRERTGT